MIVLKDVTKVFRDLRVLDGVSLRIEPGEFVCVTGPSGAGKSTLLSLLVGAQDVTGGSISVDGVDLRSVPSGALQMFRRKVGFVFQDYKLLQNRTVAENLAFPLEVIGASDKEVQARVTELLRRMELGTRADALPWQLSGGEKARVAIARAIVHKPLIILADEPTGNLDPQQARAVIDLFQEIHTEGTTIVLATHDVSLVNGLKTRVVALVNGRIARDSVGGYGGDAAPTPAMAERHRVFVDEPDREPEEPAKAATPVEPETASPEIVAISETADTAEPVNPRKKRRGPVAPKTLEPYEMEPRSNRVQKPKKVDPAPAEPETDPSAKGAKRKVRITSIHSD